MSQAFFQLLRYGMVGIASNVAGYLLYLLITSLEVDPKSAMSGLYAVGVGLGYFGHRQWAFAHRGAMAPSALRYLLAHAGGYALNLALLVVCVDHAGLAHQGVQAVAIVVVAAWLFLMFRYFVFPLPTAEQGGRP